MNKVIFSVLFVFAATAACAQHASGVELNFGIDGGVPVKSFGLNANPGFGADIKLGYSYNEKFALLLQGGYMSFFTTDKLQAQSVGSIGDGFIKVSGRYTFPGRLYLEPQIGFSTFNGHKSRAVSGNGFTYAGAVGYFADKARTFDVSIRYESTTNDESVTFIGLRVAYRLAPGRFL